MRRRSLLAAGLAALATLAVLIGLGTWQLQRRAWKEVLIAQIEGRAHGTPGDVVPEARWRRWDPSDDEFRTVRLTGAFLHEAEALVHGLAAGERSGAPALGFYVFTPLQLAKGELVLVNRGFVPAELRDFAARPLSRPEGQVSLTGLVRAPEARGLFTPDDVPAQNRFFAKDHRAIAAAKGLARVAPFYVEADAAQNPGGWPRGGQTRLDLPNNHLQYALTWFGIALTLVAVFAAFAWKGLEAGRAQSLAPPDRRA